MSGLGPGFRGTFWPGDTQELYIGASGVRNPSLSGYCQFPKWLHRLTPPSSRWDFQMLFCTRLVTARSPHTLTQSRWPAHTHVC